MEQNIQNIKQKHPNTKQKHPKYKTYFAQLFLKVDFAPLFLKVEKVDECVLNYFILIF